MRTLHRRRALAGLAALGAGAITLAPNRAAEADQECRVPEYLLADLGDLIHSAEQRFDDVALSEVPNISAAENAVRDRALKVLPAIRNYDYSVVVRHDQLHLTNDMVRRSIEPLKFDASIIRKPEDVEVGDEGSCTDVVIAIVFETFGLDAKIRKTFSDALKKRRLYKLARKIGKAAQKRDWPRATLLLRKFLRRLGSAKTLLHLEKAIGRRALRRILAVFASRFVPILGWIVLAGALATSLWSNRKRLEACRV